MSRLFDSIVGLVFLVAGLLKLMDPVGSGLVVETYLGQFGMTGLMPLAKAAGVALAALEATLGVCLVCGVRRAPARCLSALLLAGFSVMLALVVRKGADMSCGCFGDAIPMSPQQSIVKNAVLLSMLLAATLVRPRPARADGSIKAAAALEAGVLLFGAVCLFTLPPIDFTPLRKGAEVEYEDISLNGPVAVMSFYTRDFRRLEGFRARAVSEGRRPVVLSVYPLEGAHTADRRFIMTLNRRNGGVTLLDDGVIVDKRP